MAQKSKQDLHIEEFVYCLFLKNDFIQLIKIAEQREPFPSKICFI
jgi:hypothetical protein